ncbi:MAG TPA: hypothetical protein VE129_03980 [Thermoanaerobaculia bacterium]|nr:hypothetical protein [Thermoanaerobaculia bacterium]
MTVPSRRPSPALFAFGALVLAILVAASILVGRVARLPGEMAGAIPRTIRETAAAVSEGLAKLAAAIRTRRITTTFASTATEIRGTKRLQVAELSQVEVVERRDAMDLLGVPLPDVVVSARAPVTFTYFLDLDGKWDFDLTERTVTVLAPALAWNAPAVDVSRLTIVTAESSILRDEAPVVEELRASLTGILAQRARRNVPLVRETARRQAEEFVRAWLLRAYGVPEDVRVVVRFRGEPEAMRPAGPGLPPRG